MSESFSCNRRDALRWLGTGTAALATGALARAAEPAPVKRHFVFQIPLDEPAAAKVGELRRLLAGIDGLNVPPPTERPHVTLMSAAAPLAATRDAAAAVATIGAFDLEFGSLGIFPNRRPVVFLGVTPTPALLELQRRLHELVVKEGIELSNFSTPGHVFFHSTLVYAASAEAAAAAITHLGPQRLPFATHVARAELIDYPTGTTVVELPLGAAGA